MKIKEVAELLHVSPETVRIGLQQGVFPFGTAFKTKPTNKQFTYVIYEEKLKQYAGVRNNDKI